MISYSWSKRRWSYKLVKSNCEIIIVNFFYVRRKNRRKRNKQFKLLFLKINLHFGISDYISTCGKLNILPINSIFLVFPSREMQRSLMQTKVSHKLFLFSLKRSVSQSFKSSSCKKSFPIVFIIDMLRWIFSIPGNNCKQYFFTQIYRYS